MSNNNKTWTFLTNHSQVLLCIVNSPEITTREIAQRVGITERSVQGIVKDLEVEGYIKKTKIGRNNHYELNEDQPLRHPEQSGHTVAEIIDLLSRS